MRAKKLFTGAQRPHRPSDYGADHGESLRDVTRIIATLYIK
jgi:hypothetical protein